jgi:hypothetical protein
MAKFPIFGVPYLAPTNATTGGTQLVGITDRRVEFDDGARVRTIANDIRADAFVTLRAPGVPPALIIPLGDVSATARKLLYSLLTSGGSSLQSHAGNVYPLNLAQGYSLVIRPDDTNQLYWYSGRVTMHEQSKARMVWAPTGGHFDGSELVLMPERSLDGTKRAWMHDTAANINTHYGL